MDTGKRESTEELAMIQRLKDQMLIVLLKRLADEQGEFKVSVAEVNDTFQDVLVFEATPDQKDFIFKLTKKD